MCQVVCVGGTVDNQMTPGGNLWWNGVPSTNGCTIKTGWIRPGGFYAQNGQYTYYNAPAGSGGQAECCSQALNACQYKGSKKSNNYKTSVKQALKSCANVPGAGKSIKSVCAYFNDNANCGNQI